MKRTLSLFLVLLIFIFAGFACSKPSSPPETKKNSAQAADSIQILQGEMKPETPPPSMPTPTTQPLTPPAHSEPEIQNQLPSSLPAPGSMPSSMPDTSPALR